ncbi:uncharacterized protein BKA55DRAFT_577243 [Fusarium redolens]|uniref:Protein kinase domain-containing protein n=1 Tax=Fusarium redolens TaxID=48865 RepID=A0A9P9K1A6_FUSRE|nr:uncharacterized protein BKA55DRAFT_577243 [Fusarium redolens]KAH7240270.1 hypothetical protein BKA55DRAFT_577243 [Fusarium redolens]
MSLECVGVALAVADIVHTLTVYLVQGLSDTSNFGSDLESTRLALSTQANTFKDIKTLLFGPSGSQDQGIFAQFDTQTQLDIISILRHFRTSLESQYTLVNRKYGATTPSLGIVLDPDSGFGSHHTSTVFKRLQWGFSQKSKVDKIHAARQNKLASDNALALSEQVQTIDLSGNQDPLGLKKDLQLANLALDYPLSTQRRQDLQITEQAKILAYENARDVIQPTERPQPPNNGWRQPSPIAFSRIKRRLVQFHDQIVLLEYKDFVADEAGQPSEATQARIAQLARILNESKPERYRTLQCSAYYFFEERFTLAFPIPSSLNPKYTTLAQILDSYKGQPPSLDDRFILARKLCAAVAQLHTVGWVHKSIRSDNILFFNTTSEDLQASLSSSAKTASTSPGPEVFESLYLSGWEYSRPETGLSSVRSGSEDIDENIYRHPDQWGLPTIRFNRNHDIYSLGVILLEISRWKRAINFHPSRFRNCEVANVVRNYFIQEANNTKTSGSMGYRYQGIILKCLQGTFDPPDVGADLEIVQDDHVQLDFNIDFENETFYHQVIEILDEIVLHL